MKKSNSNQEHFKNDLPNLSQEEPPAEETFYHIGQLFSRTGDTTVFKLVFQPSDMVKLYGIELMYFNWGNSDGKPFTRVADSKRITRHEFAEITADVDHRFIPITKEEAKKIIVDKIMDKFDDN